MFDRTDESDKIIGIGVLNEAVSAALGQPYYEFVESSQVRPHGDN